MSTLLLVAASTVAALALVAASAVLLRTRRAAIALHVLLDLLLAAGLLRLAAVDDWQGILAVAAIVGVRHGVMWALRQQSVVLQRHP